MTVDELIRNLDEFFGPVPQARAEGYLREFVRQLRAYEGETLGDAYKSVMDDWDKIGRPLPATFRKACVRLAPKPTSAPATLQAWKPSGPDDPKHPRYPIKLIVDETLRVYAADIEMLSRDCGSSWRVVSEIRHRIEYRAVKGCRQKPPISYVSIDDEEWALIRHLVTCRVEPVNDAAQRRTDPYVEARRVVSIERANRTDGVEQEPSRAAALPPPASAGEFTYAEVAEKDESASTPPPIAKSPILEDVSPF